MTICYLTIIDGRTNIYLNETIEGAVAAIKMHVKDVLDIDADDEVEEHMTKMAAYHTIEFVISSGRRSHGDCKIECRTIQLEW